MNCQANTQFFVNLQLKENMSYKGPMPAKDTIRKILILKIKNSSVYFNYPLEVFVFESTHAGGMSWTLKNDVYVIVYVVIFKKTIFALLNTVLLMI